MADLSKKDGEEYDFPELVCGGPNGCGQVGMNQGSKAEMGIDNPICPVCGRDALITFSHQGNTVEVDLREDDLFG